MGNFTVALIGNPNAGKTTLFNALTGSHQHVGNWPGKTVERKHGILRRNGCEMEIVDLPGIYSLSAFSTEESITRDFLIDSKPDIVAVILDTSNLERHLYLVVQMLELHPDVIVVLGMSDIADSMGYEVDPGKMSAMLGGVPVIKIAAAKGNGVEDLRDYLIARCYETQSKETTVSC